MSSGRSGRAVPVSAWCIVLVLTLAVAPSPLAEADSDAERALRRAAQAASGTPYAGEVLWVTLDGEDVAVSRVDVDHSATSGLWVGSSAGWSLTMDEDGAALLDDGAGWFEGLPPLGKGEQGLGAFREKYDVEMSGGDRLLDRATTQLEVRRRAQGDLRERLWVDEETGLILRRETYTGDVLARIAVYLSLDLRPVPRVKQGRSTSRAEGLVEPHLAIAAVDDAGLAALEKSGWDVPEDLPDGYRRVASYAVSAEGQPLQSLYHDGLYTVSVFQQPGAPDWDSLPSGARPSTLVEWDAYEWPGAVPRRLVWHGAGRTWSLVGDAPPDDLAAIAEALPRPEDPGLLRRFARGLRRLWTAVSPWGAPSGPDEPTLSGPPHREDP